ncbi:MAG: hypothetical protein ACD_76C00145G0004 [uncultured bacterium]|nr:MAG: hypothetical protein ACD_76C00145G0004 [uncultured bacterium]HBD05377.1 hypothetical protein [Candidatus Uhrbacteria bacterium]
MQSKKLAKSKPGKPTQHYVDISEIREGVVVLKDGTMRAVILASSINFALKSADEQEAMIQAYMHFLNGLEHPLQIVVQSRRMNIEPYIISLQEARKKQKNELLKAQIEEYMAFIQELVSLGDIMEKRFYVVVPYDPKTDKKRNFFSRMSSALSPASVIRLKEKQFKTRKQQLMQRVFIAQEGLNSMGIVSEVLDTQTLIELYYSVYNPDLAQTQHLVDVNKIRVD